MTNIYEAPMAKVVRFEAIDVITVSVTEPIDTPEKLTTWGKTISEFASSDCNLFI